VPVRTVLSTVVFIVCCSFANLTAAQTPTASPRAPQPSPSPSPTPVTRTKTLEHEFIRNIIRDQQGIWTSPFRIKASDAPWVGGVLATTAALIATDRHTSAWVSQNGSLSPVSRYVSWGGTPYAELGLAGAFYFIGRATDNDRARETGLLSAEAFIDSGIVAQVLKYATNRPRPNFDNGRGTFFKGGVSFPSGHATSAWSVATVIAYEYWDHPAIRYGAFAAAAVVAMSRYSGRNHFLSDVLVGSGIGFYTGRYVYHAHHVQPSAPGDDKLLPKKTTMLIPTILPLYDRRSMTYGGKLEWSF
jgi:membrane-associated phospholipid phosphatase